MDKLKLIKSLVFIMTTIMFFGLIMCVRIIYDKNHHKNQNLNDISLSQPFGSKIKNIVADDEYLYIMLRGGGINDRIAVFSPQEHKVLYIINID